MDTSVYGPEPPLPDWAKPNKNANNVEQDKSNIVGAIKKVAFVVGTALIVFVSARNSLTWYCEQFWGASKHFWEDRWEDIYVLFQGNEFLLSTVGSTFASAGVFWFFSSFFLYVDITGKPKWMMKYKIQEDKPVPVDRKKLWQTVKLCLFNQFLAFLLSIPLYYVAKIRGIPFTSKQLPTFHWVVLEIGIFTLIEEVCFYYSHRLFHHPKLYKYIHKKHHEWTAPLCIVAIYAHPLEHIVSNTLPIILGPMLMGSHIATAWLWYCLAYMSTIISHSGFHVPFLPSPEAHDYHHLKFINNFGVLGVLDRLHGTDNLFVRSKCYDRHFLLLSLSSAKELVPDQPKKGECCAKKCD